jgi:hypothetical protein
MIEIEKESSMPIIGIASSGVRGSFSSKHLNALPAQAQISEGVEKGFYSWLYGEARVVGVGVGTLGTGVLSGSVSVLPGVELIEGGLRGAGVGGALASELSVAVGLGLAGEYGFVGSGGVVGLGALSVGVVVGSSVGLSACIEGGLRGVGLSGQEVSRLASGFSVGVYGMFARGIIKGGIVGSPSPFPSSGPVSGNFI